MLQQNDTFLTEVTVRIFALQSSVTIGSGVLYTHASLKNKAYIITAAHCLYEDSDNFATPYNEVGLSIFNRIKGTYLNIPCLVNYDLVSRDKDKDVAIIILDKLIIDDIWASLPEINIVRTRNSATDFAIKGFATAAQGKEIVCIYPTWVQKMVGVNKFQLNLKENFTDDISMSSLVDGFSGSGVFIQLNNSLYLYGIFTRFREAGKVIYCQYISSCNEILRENFLAEIDFTYFGEFGIDHNFFKAHIETAIDNLGPRFNEKLNFKLPISFNFNSIVRDSVFKNKFLLGLDKWLTDRDYSSVPADSTIINKEQLIYVNLRQNITNWTKTVDWDPSIAIDISLLSKELKEVNLQVSNKRHELLQMQWKESGDGKVDKSQYDYKMPYEQELRRLSSMSENNYKLLKHFNESMVHLSNNPCLLIKGDAGSGKSHILGDIAQQRQSLRKPTLLLLGQLFKKDNNLWENIIAQLGLSCSKKELLNTLNNIGIDRKERVLLLIDALNEGAGKDIWHDELVGFIREFKKYSFIGVVLTVRSTYWKVIVPEAIQKDPLITILQHEGFKGSEYAALRMFCEYYGLQQPNFPILAPEYTNPLFLQLICEGVQASNKKVFPQGFQGINIIFEYYLKAVFEKISKKREEYRLRKNLVQQVVDEIAGAFYLQQDNTVLTQQDIVDLFDSKFPRHQHLLDDLIHENLFIQNVSYNYSKDEEDDVIYFAYERMGDYYMAKLMLKNYSNKIDIIDAFKEQNALGQQLARIYNFNTGILEALAVLLPEKYNTEITEALNWVFDKEEYAFTHMASAIDGFMMSSLKWRTIKSIDEHAIIAWLQSDKCSINYNDYLLRLVELTTIHNHPFNSDRLHKLLMTHSMPKRDAFWQNHLRYYSHDESGSSAYPMARLIDWAWQPSISSMIDSETARLTAQAISWVLASTNRSLRDKATKALVNLLEEQPDSLVNILQSFMEVDDYYILERLYAVAYGCSLRTSQDEGLKNISMFIYDNTFKNASPPNHVLLRDYARNTIEYAVYKNKDIDVNMGLVRPPYQSAMPEHMPTDDEIRKYDLNHQSPEYKKINGRAYNQIHHSVMHWDFGRYIIDSALRDFLPIGFAVESEYNTFIKKIPVKTRSVIKSFIKTNEIKRLYDAKTNKSNSTADSQLQKLGLVVKNLYADLEKELRDKLTQEQFHFISEQWIPYLIAIENSNTSRYKNLDPSPIKRWIVQRAFDLGYDSETHGDYDNDSQNISRHGNIVERIGKKYQWIAFYEIMAMITDNYKMRDDWGWNNKVKFEIYQGAWQHHLRNIDPAYVTKNQPDEEDDYDSLGLISPNTEWWLDSTYNYWNQPIAPWLINTNDLPNIVDIIQRSDNQSQDWLYLSLMVSWQEPKPVGQDKYDIDRKQIWYIIQGYLIKKNDKLKTINWLKEQNFRGNWMPENNTFISLYNRENYWSPASKDIYKHHKEWQIIKGSRLKVIVATEEAVGEMSEDKSGAHSRYDMPCKTLFEGMNLKYASKDGDFKNIDNEIVVSNANPKGVLIKKTDLNKFLEKEGLDIIWAVLGEKQSIGEHGHNNKFATISAVYYLEDSALKGSLKILEDDK